MNIFNLTNTASFDTPNNNVSVNFDFSAPPNNFSIEKAFNQSSQQIGLIQHALGSPRQIQFVGRFVF